MSAPAAAPNGEHRQHYVSQVPAHDSGYYGNPDLERAGGAPAPLPHPHQATISQVYDPRVGKIANPGPLGLISFGITTFVLGFYQCGVGYVSSSLYFFVCTLQRY